VGASGSGKSTLLGCWPVWTRRVSGEIWLDGVPIHNLVESELAAVRGKKIALFSSLTSSSRRSRLLRMFFCRTN